MSQKPYIWSVNKTLNTSEEVKERLGHLSNITFSFTEPPIEGQYSCFRIFIGRKYYIAKTKTCMWLESHLNKLLKAYNTNGIDGNDLYFPIVKHIHNTGYYDVRIEFICQSENAYEVIKAEFLALENDFGSTLCMNKSNIPYTPKYNSKTKMHGWLTINQFLNFCRLVKAHRK